MKILMIRHGQPDYEHDCLTPHGREEAALLAKRLLGEDISAVYASPMGRAQETAEAYTRLSGHSVTTLEWLREFNIPVTDIESGEEVITWDMRPKIWTKSDLLSDPVRFPEAPELAGSPLVPRWQEACEGLDALLASHSLVREGGIYRKLAACDETIALFCHFGITCVMAAHLLGTAPMITLQGFSAEPTAVATLCTDDRFGSEVNFRMHGYGDISHLGKSAGGALAAK